jgi:hypothetical protein
MKGAPVQLGLIVLYVLFVPVGVWLLTEAMWQHGAPFRYRVLAVFGFAGVVAGAALGNPIITGAGAFCFLLGQFLVTRYVRSGYYHGWTVRFGRKRARRSRHARAVEPAAAAGAGHENAYENTEAYEDFAGPEHSQAYGNAYGNAGAAPDFAPFEPAATGAPGAYAYPEHGHQQGEFPPAAYEMSDSDRYLYGDTSSFTAGQFASAEGQVGVAASGEYAVPGAYATGNYPAQGDYAAPGSGEYAVPGTGEFAAPGSGEYAVPGQWEYGVPGSGEYGVPPRPQGLPMSSATDAAPIPTPMSPPPGWAEAPTAYNPGTGERLG